MFFIGLDLGQKRDHTAIAIVERRDVRLPYQAPEMHHLAVRRVERVPLGTPYPAVVERVRRMVEHDHLRGGCSLTVDGTGLGAPVVDLLRRARLGCEVTAVTMTGGERERCNGSGVGSNWSVPKRDLIAGVQVLLERGELRIGRRLSEVQALVKELMDIRATGKSNGRTRLGADGCGEHDDLVIALALACWRAKKSRNMSGAGRLNGI